MADMPKGNFPCLFLYKDEVEGGKVSTKIEIILRSVVKVVSSLFKYVFDIRSRKYMKELLKKIHTRCLIFLISIRPMECATR